MSDLLVEVSSLRLSYGHAPVLDGLSLQVRAGQVLALLGRNGAGKSSLIRCLLGLQPAQRGAVRLFGEDVGRHRARLLRRVGVVPETPDAPPGATPRQLADFSARVYPAWSRRRFDDHLERFGVPVDRALGGLSRGQQTQVMLALALAPEPKLLILDDPTLGLDAVARRDVVSELVDELADRGTTMVVASHDLAGLERIATHVALLTGGRLAFAEEADALKDRLRWIAVADAGASAALESLDPVVSRPLGGVGREVLVERFDSRVVADLERRHGRHAVEVRFASLEDSVIAWTDRSSARPQGPGAAAEAGKDAP